MKIPTKFVPALNKQEEEEIREFMAAKPSSREWIRAHSIKLSAKGYNIDQIADIHEVDRDTVSIWLSAWEEFGSEGLTDKPKPGRPKKLTKAEEELAKELVKQEPRALKRVVGEIATRIKKKISIDTLQELIKAGNGVWKRIRKSLKSKRDETEFKQSQMEIEELQERADDGIIDLYYFDGAGFSLDPSIPYAWQFPDEAIEVPAAHSKRVNVLGFITTDNQFESFVFQCPIDSQLVIDCFNLFCQRITKKTFVILDNAPIQTSDEFEEWIPIWQQQGLFIKYLPPYCPELNLIEILWKKIKYEWIPFSAYDSFQQLTNAVIDILGAIGSKYQISFS